jgi:hypothetical protein
MTMSTNPLILYFIHPENGMIHFGSLRFFSRPPAAAPKIVSSPVFDVAYRDFYLPYKYFGASPSKRKQQAL